MPHHDVEVAQHLVARGQLVEAGVEPDLVDATRAERRRVHAVGAGGLVQPHERVGVVPVAARPIVAIDDHHRRVGLGEHRVGEGHPRGAGPLDQVVGCDRLGHAVHCVTFGMNPLSPAILPTLARAVGFPRCRGVEVLAASPVMRSPTAPRRGRIDSSATR